MFPLSICFLSALKWSWFVNLKIQTNYFAISPHLLVLCQKELSLTLYPLCTSLLDHSVHLFWSCLNCLLFILFFLKSIRTCYAIHYSRSFQLGQNRFYGVLYRLLYLFKLSPAIHNLYWSGSFLCNMYTVLSGLPFTWPHVFINYSMKTNWRKGKK